MGIETLGGMFGGANTVSSAGTMFKWVMVFAILAGVSYFAYQYMTYKIKIELIEPRGKDKRKTTFDRAKRIKKDGVYKLKLMKKKITIKEPEFKFYDLVGKKELYRLYFNENLNEYSNLEINVNEDKTLNFETVEQDVQYWRNVESKQALTDYSGGFWDTYGGVVVPLVGFAVVGILGIIMFRQFGEISNSLAGVASALKHLQPGVVAP